MAKYSLDELIKASEAQSRRDKAIVSECIDGLGLYAAYRARDNRNSSDIDKARKLVDTLVCYWGLNEGENAKTLEDFMWDFDVRVDNAKCGQEVAGDINKACNSVIYGLHRYGMEMVTAQGDSAMKDILKAGDLIKDVAGYWDFEPYAAAEDMTAKLYAEVRVMLEGIPLPGQPVSGRSNVGYELQQATLFNNDRGFVLAHNPKDPASFVTWQFTNDNGDFSFYWGHYIVSEEWARVDYMSRITEYTGNYMVTEKPIPTAAVEMDKESNYNMIDGAQNNAEVPKPDLTDGQTFEEIRELAPEMLPDETTDDKRIPVQIMTESQPLVTVTFSEHDRLRDIVKLPLYLADALFEELDSEPVTDDMKHYATDFRIDFIRNGKPESYADRYVVNDGRGSLINHINDCAYQDKYNLQNHLNIAQNGDTGAIEATARFTFLLEELVPYLQAHCKMSNIEAAALSELMGIQEDAAGDPSDSAKVRIEYLEAIVENTWRSRAALNHSGINILPEFLQPVSQGMKNKPDRAEKPSVLKQIRDAQKTPKPPKHKPERAKKTKEPEL